MTFDQYIDNPMGKSNAVFSQREQAKAMYTEKFEQINLRENNKLTYQLFVDKTHDAYYVYMMVPSETTENFYYDVVLKFTTTDNSLRTSNTLSGYDVRFFSNDPAFVYTYARVFYKNHMFIDELKSKGSKYALKNDPVQRNSYMVPGYVKSLYFAHLYMKSKGLFSKILFTTSSSPYNRSKLMSLVTDTDKKLEERHIAETDQKKAKKLADQKAKSVNTSHNRLPDSSGLNSISKVKKINRVNSTKRVNRINPSALKTVKSSKKTKKI